jgi:hypothetical protein
MRVAPLVFISLLVLRVAAAGKVSPLDAVCAMNAKQEEATSDFGALHALHSPPHSGK